MTDSEKDLALAHYTQVAKEAEAEARGARATAEIVADLRSIADDMDRAEWDDCVGDQQHSDSETLREAADRLERPTFTANQMQAVADAIGGEYNRTGVPRFLARAALSAIGTVEGDG